MIIPIRNLGSAIQNKTIDLCTVPLNRWNFSTQYGSYSPNEYISIGYNGVGQTIGECTESIDIKSSSAKIQLFGKWMTYGYSPTCTIEIFDGNSWNTLASSGTNASFEADLSQYRGKTIKIRVKCANARNGWDGITISSLLVTM